uniref:Uncharacterized protein n=1 Tax=Arundo donax TaxID=35708 RepID=A0A0A9ER57_ARUDO
MSSACSFYGMFVPNICHHHMFFQSMPDPDISLSIQAYIYAHVLKQLVKKYLWSDYCDNSTSFFFAYYSLVCRWIWLH